MRERGTSRCNEVFHVSREAKPVTKTKSRGRGAKLKNSGRKKKIALGRKSR